MKIVAPKSVEQRTLEATFNTLNKLAVAASILLEPIHQRAFNAIGTGMILQYAVQKLATVIKGRIRGGL